MFETNDGHDWDTNDADYVNDTNDKTDNGDCDTCNGTGYDFDEGGQCSACAGTGEQIDGKRDDDYEDYSSI